MREMKKVNCDWLDLLPNDWSIKPLKSTFSFGKGLPITKADLVDSGIPVVSYGQIHAKYNPGTHLVEPLFRHVDSTYLSSNPSSLVHKGDILIADTSEDLDGCGNCVYIDKKMPLFAGYHTIILSSKNGKDNKYLAYLFQTDAWRSQIRKQLTDVKLFSVSQKTLSSLQIIVPPEDEACAIAGYLDTKCAAIDASISRHKAIVEKLEQHKNSIVCQAVAKGLDESASMKDSRIDWIGNIPAHWECCPVQLLFREHKAKNTGMKENNLLSLSYGRIKRKDINSNEGLLPVSFESYNIIEPGYIVFRFTDLQNDHRSFRTGLCKERGIITSAYVTIAPVEEVDCRYMHYLFHSYDVRKVFYGMGDGIRQGMNYEDLRRMKIIRPPLSEQVAIADYLNEKCVKIDEAISCHRSLITKLENYRKSLIYHAVTGKIDCRKEAHHAG